MCVIGRCEDSAALCFVQGDVQVQELQEVQQWHRRQRRPDPTASLQVMCPVSAEFTKKI